MKILQLTPQYPYPASDGGKIGIASIYESFVNLGHDVVMCSIVQDLQEHTNQPEYNPESHYLFEKNTKNNIYLLLKNLINSNSTYIQKHKSNQILSKISKICIEFQPDIIWADHTNMAWYAIEIAKHLNVKTAVRLHNIEHVIWKRYAQEVNNPLKKAYINFQANKLKKDEVKVLEKIDNAIPITNVDKKYCSELNSNSTQIMMKAGVGERFMKFQRNANFINHSLVIGTNYSWVHNVNGLLWFIENVLKPLKSEFPDIKLHLLGKNPPEILTKKEGVYGVGFVEDFAEEVTKYQIYIAPLLVGGGIRIKILEAMALGLPVVATEISAEGIEANQSNGLFISDNAEKMIKDIKWIFDNPDKYQELSISAKEYISENHNWEKLVAECLSQIDLN